MLVDATEEEHEEMVCIRARIGDNFEHATELNPMKCKQVMKMKDKNE